ncbi:MAG: hypothetical protein EON58_22255 [Alphaproteobacteria bacterium]|nr:MAG: hypothetical protein EON58_22255 [Alphaproteobacteria bacterium]
MQSQPWILFLYLLICVAGIYPALILTVLIHEIGHALFATLAGYRVTSFGLGYGKPLVHVRLPAE